ncbi:sigma-54-dependent Fis family transcriptional regulator [Planosporangium mesophilum]|uniref:Fis family transcriptional regulator n=1 Tax=Planosporangium mesophilum TaxID=689768 RepID=A0A8J3TI73_9ACTN|nr:GAF domain-containing protein [Planosporangium mesophilum]NJC86434.1 GAF domain-containing protein [Planosporangium mesophilum]GII25139.1 Fis family transcriptional regulator [Planosporangium mesophilum]
MPPTSTPPPAPAPADDRLAKTRERFLTAEKIEPSQVRGPILASWWRSRRGNVAADRIDLSYVRDPDLDTPMTRSALPVLRKLREHLDGQPISIILTDPAGVVLSRLAADRDLDRHLDRVQLAPGFSYAEGSVGTNGIGTALEGGQPMHVFGHEHYAENLENLACAGVPIHHPISGKTVGAVDLTCWSRDASPLLMTLVKTTADQVRQALLVDSGIREFELLKEYRRACRRNVGIVLALNSDVVMMNEYAQRLLGPGDQSAILGQAAETLASRRPESVVVVDLPTGVRARLYCRPVRGDGDLAGGVVHVKLIESDAQPGDGAAFGKLFLPGLVGSGPLWLRGCHEVEAVYDSGDWLAVQGEPGVGKLAVIRAVHRRRSPTGRFQVLDAADAGGDDWLSEVRRELLEAEDALVIRHIDRLHGRRLRAVSGALHEARAECRDRRPWVAVTLNHGSDDLTPLLDFFPSTVELPPLRHHIEDVHELVPFFLSKLNHGRLACSPEAMQLLMRSAWPGNTEQLWQVLKRIAAHRRAGSIHPDDLPPECRTVSRRLLSPLEAIERDAIVKSLRDADGNKVKAAESLGMSRATIYRKIREYGIVALTG